MYAGWDEHFGFQLYHSDPSGNYGGWKATAIGANNQTATSLLRQEWKPTFTLDEALKLAVKVLAKTMDSTALTPEKLEFGVLKRENEKVKWQELTDKELETLIASVNLTSITSPDDS